MHWLRSRLRLGSGIALFALALQLVLAFGHVHLDGGPSASARAATTLADGTDNPTDSDAPPGAHHDCAACVLLQLAGSLIHSHAPTLSLPVLSAGAPQGLPVAPGSSGLKPAQFRARGPPVA